MSGCLLKCVQNNICRQGSRVNCRTCSIIAHAKCAELWAYYQRLMSTCFRMVVVLLRGRNSIAGAGPSASRGKPVTRIRSARGAVRERARVTNLLHRAGIDPKLFHDLAHGASLEVVGRAPLR
jgi:hypothetical protein